MKTKIVSLFICSLFYLTASAQLNQRFDNTNYKAIYFEEACRLMATNPDLILLDVRSPGEFADTSRFITLDIGRLKGAINISIDSIPKHFASLKAYKNKTILTYCSHSQRSRVVSKLLADSGFTKVYSLNGGMTEVNKITDAGFPCKASLYTIDVPYKLLGVDDGIAFIRNKNNVIIDVRPASAFNGTDTAVYANVGRIKGAINAPLATLDAEMGNLSKYKDRAILLYELNSNDAMEAAKKLTKAGFKNVNVLFEGLEGLLANTASSSKTRAGLVTGGPDYKIIGVRETIDLVNNTPNLVVADMRPKESFENKAKPSFFNLGHIKGARNFTEGSLDAYLVGKPKDTPILVYGASSPATRGMRGMQPQTNTSALSKQLAARGYTHVYLLFDGLYSVVWSSANVASNTDAVNILVDHQGLY